MSAMRLTDNIKAIRVDDLPPEAWTYITGGADDHADVLRHYERVPWLYRAVNLRMDAVKSLPYKVRLGEEWYPLEEVDLEQRLRFKLSVRNVFEQWEGHLALFGAAYGDKRKNLIRATGLQVLHPTTVKPKTDRAAGLVGFTRRIGGVDITYDADEIVYVWLPSMQYEIGPGTPPAKAALNAAGMLEFMQVLGRARFEKGAINPMLMVVPDGTTDADKERLESWAKRLVSGVKNAFGITAVREGVSFQELGGKIADLAMPELTTTQREEIATALGVPQTLLFSNAANFATAQQDYRQFYDTTVIPDAQRLCEALNEQLLEAAGLELSEAHEELEMYQDDKEAESYRLLAGVEAGLIEPDEFRARLDLGEMTPDVRAKMLQWLRDVAVAKNPITLDSPASVEPTRAEQAAGEAQAREARTAVTQDVETETKAHDAPTLEAELDKWRRKAERRFSEGKPEKALEFESDVIPPAYADAIRGALEAAQDAAGINAAFVWGLYP